MEVLNPCGGECIVRIELKKVNYHIYLFTKDYLSTMIYFICTIYIYVTETYHTYLASTVNSMARHQNSFSAKASTSEGKTNFHSFIFTNFER